MSDNNNTGFQLSGLLYPCTHYPPVIRRFPRFFGQEIWPVAMRSTSLSRMSTIPPMDSFEEREIERLNIRVKELERELDNKQRLFRFTSRVSKKLVCIGQMSNTEMMDAIELGIGIDFGDSFWTPSTRDVSTSCDEHKLTDSFSAQFPEPDEDGTYHSTVVLHKGGETQISEMSIGASKPEDSITGVIAHGAEPEIDDIMFYYGDDSNDAIPADLTLKECLDRLNRADETNKRTDARFKVTMKQALEIERLASNLVLRIIQSRNSKTHAAGSKTVIPIPVSVRMPSSSATMSKQDMMKNAPENPPPISPVCVRGDAGRHVSGIPVRILPPRIKPKHVTFAQNPVAGPSRRITANVPQIPGHGALKVETRAPPKRYGVTAASRGPRTTTVRAYANPNSSRPRDRIVNNGRTNTVGTIGGGLGPSNLAGPQRAIPTGQPGNPESTVCSATETETTVCIPEENEEHQPEQDSSHNH